ncbi:MAG: ATP-binding protein, partial [Kiritimatiellia bacterium]
GSRWRLSSELVLWHSLALALICLAIGMISHRLVLRPIRDRLPQEAGAFAEALADQIREPLWYLDGATIAAVLERQRLFSSALGIRVVNQFDDVLAEWTPDGLPVASGIDVMTPVFYRDELIGRIHVTWSVQALQVLQSGVWPALLAITVCGIAMQFWLTWWLTRRFLQIPLYGVSRSLRQVADGHFTVEIPDARHQELRVLLNEARRMAARIRERTVALHAEIAERQRVAAELIRHKADLEALVEQRTQALAAANRSLRQEIEQRKQAQRAIIDISTREQQRIGQDLHDTLGQELVGARYLFAALERSLDTSLPALTDRARQVSAMLRDIMEHVRMLAHGMMVVDLREGGLAEALRHYADKTAGVFPLSCVFKQSAAVFTDADATVSVQLYFIAREAINNAIRHGRSSKIRIRLGEHQGYPAMLVTDNGCGFDPREDVDGIGLFIMRNRAESIGAVFSVWSRPGRGSCIRCVLATS